MKAGNRTSLTAGAVIVGSVLVGHWLASATSPLVHNRMFPWIAGRGLGVASYLSLTALVTAGLWFRHPWATHRAVGRATRLRFHAVLAAATVVLVAGHVTALALDRYAGVGWAGVFLPGHATYRPAAVTLGTLALYGIVLTTATAALAGIVGRHAWYPVHQLSLGIFAVSAWHGITAGSDTSALRLVYAATIVLVSLVAATRALAGRSRPVPEPVQPAVQPPAQSSPAQQPTARQLPARPAGTAPWHTRVPAPAHAPAPVPTSPAPWPAAGGAPGVPAGHTGPVALPPFGQPDHPTAAWPHQQDAVR